MVVFTCNHCGDSLQKPKVEKHYSFVCRTVKSLTCVDCFKDFRGEEYVTHTKCLTEDERYAAKGTYVNGIVKKGEVKQESWVEMIKSILNTEKNLKPPCRNLLNSICHFSNIPRKKPKFINFVKSSLGGRANLKDVEEVWNIIEKYKSDKAKEAQTNNVKPEDNKNSKDCEEKVAKNGENETKKRKTNGDHEDVLKKKSKTENEPLEKDTFAENQDIATSTKKKSKSQQENLKLDTEIDKNREENVKFSFEEKILEIVTAKGSISVKKLQKKVLNAYIKSSGKTEITPKDVKKFNKKLKNLPSVSVDDDKVTVLQTCG